MKKAKIIILLSLMMAMAAEAQTLYNISYKYDQSGNRIERRCTLQVAKMAQNELNDSITPKDTAIMNEIVAGIQDSNAQNSAITEQSIINVYPNPTSDKVVVSYSSVCASCQLRIYNSEAKQVYESKGVDKQTEIDLSHLGTGVYYLSITTEDGKGQGWKIVKR